MCLKPFKYWRIDVSLCVSTTYMYLNYVVSSYFLFLLSHSSFVFCFLLNKCCRASIKTEPLDTEYCDVLRENELKYELRCYSWLYKWMYSKLSAFTQPKFGWTLFVYSFCLFVAVFFLCLSIFHCCLYSLVYVYVRASYWRSCIT